VMRKATLPKVERVNRLEGQLKGGFLDVMMGEVFSPQHFYIQLKDPGSEKPGYELDDLVDEMEDTYCKLSNLDHYIPFDELTEDMHCVVNIPAEKNTKWYRAVISALEGAAVQVYLLDFGQVATVPNTPEHLKHILPQFCSCMPAQAIRATLDARLIPPLDCTNWPEESTERFLQMTRAACDYQGEGVNVGLVAQFLGRNRDGVPVLELFDTVSNDKPDGINLGLQLVEEGLARVRSEKVGKVGKVLLSSGYLRTVSLEAETWLTSAEVSQFQTSWRGYDLVGPSLSRKESKEFTTRRLVREEESDLWKEMKEAGVGGIFSRGGEEVSEITLYRLVDLMEILEVVGGTLDEKDRASILETISS